MGDSPVRGAAADDLERAVRAYETAVAQDAPSGRHVPPEELASERELASLRVEVVRRAEAIPTISWPRPACAHCEGAREVRAMQARHGEAGTMPTFVPVRQMCPRCWGAGLLLNLEPDTVSGDLT